EAGYGTISTSLEAGRYDLYAGLWPSADRSKAITFSAPIYYDAIYAYARNNDQRFNNNLDAINSSQIKISTIDGELADTIARETFSSAQRVSLPQTAPFDQLALQVISNKADITFLPPASALAFSKANPGTLKRVSDTPVRIYEITIGVKLGETNLKNMLDVVVKELITTGTVKQILEKYDPTALQVAPPYTK
ncbi:MAG: transporter substrate-binding domain-containing protein, partial [Patescibacteria group bacterium]